MYKIFKANKDTYITNKFVSKKSKKTANVGYAGSLDLFKLYGNTLSGSTPVTELSRILISFDTTKLFDLYQANKIDITDPSFKCEIKLFDVYGGQTTPIDFSIAAYPLSRSFSEGLGRDVVYYSDIDTCNYLTSSKGGEQWILEGCAATGSNLELCDYYTTLNGESLLSEQRFTTGYENLLIDVTKIISATLKNEIANNGFRISFSDDIENDQKSYFVKRFASRHAYDKTKHPQLILKFDDSKKVNSDIIYFNTTSSLQFFNYVNYELQNLISSSSEIIGNNALKLRLETEISGGFYSLIVSASQYSKNNVFNAGHYFSQFYIGSDNAILQQKLIESGTFQLKPIWMSNDETFAFHTGSYITVKSGEKLSSYADFSNFIVTCNVDSEIQSDSEKFIRVNIFDDKLSNLKLVKTPIETKSLIVKKTYYRIRNAITNEIVIPFDEVNNSTMLSNDEKSMYFILDCNSLFEGNLYVVDILMNIGDNKTIFENVSSKFKIIQRT